MVVGYLGHLDVILLWPFAALRRTPVVWDAFLSLYDTVVLDRRMVSASHPLAWMLKAWEWVACRAAKRIVLDTQAQAEYFEKSYGLHPSKVTSVFVGAEAKCFDRVSPRKSGERPKVLFYGQFIPLHGISTIIEAARLSREQEIDWTIIGRGQMADHIRQLLAQDPIDNLEWLEWIPYAELSQHIEEADVCLGVFGESDKAGRVIPNKVFQTLCAGRPLVTRDGPGMRELVSDDTPGVRLVPPSDARKLVEGIEEILASRPFPPDLHSQLCEKFSEDALAEKWALILQQAAGHDA